MLHLLGFTPVQSALACLVVAVYLWANARTKWNLLRELPAKRSRWYHHVALLYTLLEGGFGLSFILIAIALYLGV